MPGVIAEFIPWVAMVLFKYWGPRDGMIHLQLVQFATAKLLQSLGNPVVFCV